MCWWDGFKVKVEVRMTGRRGVKMKVMEYISRHTDFTFILRMIFRNTLTDTLPEVIS